MTRPDNALREACQRVGFPTDGAEPIRLAENEIWRLPNRVIARVAPQGQDEAARREVRVARWLLQHGVSAVRPLDVEQPITAANQPVTFWHEVPEHQHGTVRDVAMTLRTLHSLPKPDIDIGLLDPFVRVKERLASATTLPEQDRQWLLSVHADLADRWSAGLPGHLPPCLVHGDAWPGNIVRIGAERLVMDLERVSFGPPEWDLISTAVRSRTTGAVTAAEYEDFCELYGYDVTDWNGYQVLALVRELRMVSYAAHHAVRNPEWRPQAQYRVDCIRGRHGPRPWSWQGIL